MNYDNFVIQRDDINFKINFQTLKESIIQQQTIETFNPSTANDFNLINDSNKDKLLTANGGKILYNLTQEKIPLNSSNSTNVNTPLYFKNQLQLEHTNGENNKDVVNVEFLMESINRFHNKELIIEYIYGDPILTKIGKALQFDKSDPNNWIVTNKLSDNERNNKTGWENIKNKLNLKSGKRFSDYDDLTFILSDEDGDTYDSDVQIYFWNISVEQYRLYCENYKCRYHIYDSLKNVSSANPISHVIDGQKITWKTKQITKSAQDSMYISTNTYAVNNGGTSVEDRHFRLIYTDD